MDQFDVQVHHNGMFRADTRDMLDGLGGTMAGAHGEDCAPPNATHTVQTVYDSVFQSKDHMMTSQMGGYGVTYFTPHRMLDWSDGEATLSIDVSTFRTSGRDWWDLWLMQWDKQAAVPLSDRMGQAGVDLNGPPDGDYLHLNLMEQSFFKAESESGFIDNSSGTPYSASSPTQRDTFVLTSVLMGCG